MDRNTALTPEVWDDLSLESKLRFSFNMEFVTMMIKRRKELGLTQEELAQKSGIGRETIAKVEQFHSMASIKVILQLCHALNISISFIQQPAGTEAKEET